MASHYHNPICIADNQESWRGICGVQMRLVEERHPLWRPKTWTFLCPRCGCVRALTEDQLNNTAEAR